MEDAKLTERAIRDRWPIPEEVRAEAIMRMVEILVDPTTKKREKIAATRVLVAADGKNLEQIRLAILAKVTDAGSASQIIREAFELIDGGTAGGPDPANEG